MAKLNLSTKRLQIDKANLDTVVIMAVASFLVVFSIFASSALLKKKAYQGRIIKAKSTAVKQLRSNLGAASSLVNSYKDFVSSNENVLGGNPKGTGDKDGDNAKIVLDALPSKYDFPALASSLDKILSARNFKVESIVGTDDEINQQNSAGPNPSPIQMPFQITVSGNYGSVKSLVDTLQHSIRPFQIQSLELVGNDTNLRISIKANTFYLPEKNLNITTKEVR